MDNAGLDEIRAARRELDEVIAEIRTVPGYEQFLAAPTFNDVAEAAREQPLVYMAAADPGGLGLVVRGDDVAHIPLDGLTADVVRDRLTSYLQPYAAFRADQQAGLAGWRAALDDVTHWLWDAAVGPVIEEIQPAPAIFVVAGGLLGLLPLHAAWTRDVSAPTERRYALDATTISYVPNARSLTSAREIAAASATDRLVGVVDPARSASVSPLRLAPMEVQAAAAGFAGSAELLRGPAASVRDVQAALRHADVAHLACHGFADLATPLDSGLLLAGHDGVLRLRDILALSLRLRLAVLSACETSMPGTELPDEVVALPTGLLQAGVAGIVASMWAVPDTATAMLMTEFYRRWRWERLPPATALQQSQQWLRDTTNQDKRNVYEDALDNAAGWLPPDVGEAFLDEVSYREPGDRDEQGVEAWAAFAHVGVLRREREVSAMEESELRRLAAAVRAVLRSLIPDPVEADEVDAEVARALAVPEGQAKRALRAALSGHPAVRAWIREQGVSGGTGWRLWSEPITAPEEAPSGMRAEDQPERMPSEDWPVELRDVDTPAYREWEEPPAMPAQASAPAAEPQRARYLVAELPERAPAGRRISLQVSITLAPAAEELSTRMKPFDVPPEGRDVIITVSAPGLTALGDLEQDLHVPPAADSEPVRFGFMAGRAGLHTVTVRAFAGGTFLAELVLQISVEIGAALEEGPARMAEVGAMACEPGEVTLQVSITDDNRFSFQLFGDALYPVQLSERLAGDPREAVNALVAELRSFAARTSPYASPALVRNRLQNLGAQLWADAVPEAVRRQFWEQADKIKLFTVASEGDTVPWELLYPVDGDHDNGFLVEQFPVVRRVYGQGRAKTLPLASAAYVVPPGSPKNAIDEVQAIRDRLGARVADRGVLDQLDQLITLFASAPSVLHFACHNQFDAAGSVVNMADGPFGPGDLSIAAQKRSFAPANPLVFFNACRTAGEIPGLVQMMGWAKLFMRAGAGAFLGSLWAVRSSSARTFADVFYQAFVTERMPLGAASLRARQAVADDDGDPTWLAYTVYGNPAATIREEKGT